MDPRTEDPRWDRIWGFHERLPTWLWWASWPWMIPARILSFGPVVPTLIALSAVPFAYLKVNFLPELAWYAVVILPTAILWVPVFLGYLLMAWAGVGIVPFALVRFWQCRRAGQPFGLLDPAQVLPDDTGDRLRSGKALTPPDLAAIAASHEASQGQMKIILDIACVCIGPILVIGLPAVELGYVEHERISFPLFLSLSTVVPILFAWRPVPQLRCHACSRLIANLNLKRLAETGLCPRCGKPGPMTTRRPGPVAPADWDDDLA